MTKATKAQIHVRLDVDLVEWLSGEAATRMVSREYLITRAVELLRSTATAVPPARSAA